MEFYTNILMNAFRLVILQAISSLRGKKFKIVGAYCTNFRSLFIQKQSPMSKFSM